MNEQTLTIALEGEVPLREFADAMENFNLLIDGLSLDVASDSKIEWLIDSLETGSAIATVRGRSDNPQSLSAIVDAYAQVGKALQTNRPLPYSEKVVKPAQALTQLLNGKVTTIRFETPKEEIVISGHYQEKGHERREPTHSFGTLKGIVESLSRRRGIRFTIYDAIFDRPIACYLAEGEEDKVKDYWGQKVYVTGRISRDSESGKPFAIRQITQIRSAESSPPGSYKNARGVIRLGEGETPASVVRALRDG